MNKRKQIDNTLPSEEVRLDKWLWAARFFKTRALAKHAIESGRILYEGQKVKPGKLVTLGATLLVRQGNDQKNIIVNSISTRRGPAPEAQKLYTETQESMAQRAQAAAQRKAQGASTPGTTGRPSKRDRRLIKDFMNQSVNQYCRHTDTH